MLEPQNHKTQLWTSRRVNGSLDVGDHSGEGAGFGKKQGLPKSMILKIFGFGALEPEGPQFQGSGAGWSALFRTA